MDTQPQVPQQPPTPNSGMAKIANDSESPENWKNAGPHESKYWFDNSVLTALEPLMQALETLEECLGISYSDINHLVSQRRFGTDLSLLYRIQQEEDVPSHIRRSTTWSKEEFTDLFGIEDDEELSNLLDLGYVQTTDPCWELVPEIYAVFRNTKPSIFILSEEVIRDTIDGKLTTAEIEELEKLIETENGSLLRFIFLKHMGVITTPEGVFIG